MSCEALKVKRGLTAAEKLRRTVREPARSHGKLWLGERDKPETHYQFPDPTDEDTLDAYREVRGACFPGSPAPALITIDRNKLIRVLGLADGYLDLGTYELGVECVIRKLRDIRRILRYLGRAT